MSPRCDATAGRGVPPPQHGIKKTRSAAAEIGLRDGARSRRARSSTRGRRAAARTGPSAPSGWRWLRGMTDVAPRSGSQSLRYVIALAIIARQLVSVLRHNFGAGKYHAE